MALKPIDDRQVINRSALATSIGAAANSTVDVVFAQIDSVMVNLAGPQQITNKTIGVSNADLLSNSLVFMEISTPATNPTAGELALYPKSDGHFYTLNSSGTETQVGSAGSAPVGSVVSAFLTLTQFQGQAGVGWVLSQGQAVPGSEYEAIVGASTITASANATANVTGATIILSTSAFTTTGNTNSNNQITNIVSPTALAVGQIVSGTSIPADSTIVSIDQYNFALPGTANGYQFAVHSATQRTFTVSSTTSFTFTVSPASATAGATYTNNGHTYTVVTTIAGGTSLSVDNGTGVPAASGTLTLASGSGDLTITFSSFVAGGANATAGATYTNNSQTFTVNTTITNSTTLSTSGPNDPTASGVLTLTSGTGDATIDFSAFVYGGANATIGDTYTNNGNTYTVSTTITNAMSLTCSSPGIPSVSGILTKTSGTGDATIDFTSFAYLGHNATAGATYTNNGQTFTILSTVVNGVALVATGTGVPAASGTLTLGTGSGDATIPFSSFTANVTISANATLTTPGESLNFSTFAVSTTGNLTLGSNVITNVSSTSGVINGQVIDVTGIPPESTVSSFSTTTVPDCRNAVLVGAGTSVGPYSTALFATGGEGEHVLSYGEMPSHMHNTNWNFNAGGGPYSGYIQGNSPSPPANLQGAPSDYQGGNQPHNNVQPFVAANVFIRIN